MNIEIREFVVGDGDILVPVAIDRSVEKWRDWAAKVQAGGCAFTGLMKGEVCCAAGIKDEGSGKGTAWAIFSEDCKRYPRAVYRAVRTMLKVCCEEYGFTAVRSQSKVGFGASQRFLEHLGFEKIRKTIKGEDYYYKLIVNGD